MTLSISILAVFDTEGFARDAKIAKNHDIVAANQVSKMGFRFKKFIKILPVMRKEVLF